MSKKHLVLMSFLVTLFVLISYLLYKYSVSSPHQNAREKIYISDVNNCNNGKTSRLIIKKNNIFRQDINKQIVLRGAVSDYFRYGLKFNTDFTNEGISGQIKRAEIIRSYGANLIGFYLSGLPVIKTHLEQLDEFIKYAQNNGIYVYLMPVARDFEGKMYQMPQAQPYLVGTYNELKELLEILSYRYKNYPNVLYGMGAEPELKEENFNTWNEKQIELAKIIRSHNPEAIILVSSTNPSLDDYKKQPFPFSNIIYYGGGYASENDMGATNNPKIVEERVTTIIQLMESEEYPVLIGEFGGNYREDFSSPTDLSTIEKILDGISKRNVSFSAYNLSVIRENDPLTLIGTQGKLTKRGELFVRGFKSNCLMMR